jgi:hypothetical protein
MPFTRRPARSALLAALVWLAAALPALGQVHAPTPEAREAFLLSAKVVASKEIGKGVTKPWRLTLEAGPTRQDAAFQDVDRRKDEARFRSGRLERDFRDFYGYNIAAYRLARLLGYDDLVPASVERHWKGKRGAVTWWVDKKWDEDERVKAGIDPPDLADWERQLYLARAFTALVDDSDRNLGNLLVTSDFHLWLIDFTRAFRFGVQLKSPALLRRIDRRFYERLKAVSDEEIHAALSPWVEKPARDALLARRDAMIEHFAVLADQRGDPTLVFYESDRVVASAGPPAPPQEYP